MKRIASLVFSIASTCSGCAANEESTASDMPPAPWGPTLVAGMDYALEFDGRDDYATAGTAGLPIMRDPQTVSLWAWYPDTAGTQVMVVLRADFESGLALGISDDTVEAWNVYGPRVLAAATAPPARSQWHHIAYVFDGTTHMLYINGVLAGTGTRESGHRTPYLCWLGTLDGTSQLFRGRIDEVRIWRSARSREEVVLEMAQKVASDDPNLVAYWQFDSIEGTRVPDASGHGNLVSLGEGDPSRVPGLVRSDVRRETDGD